ncbi:dihydrofolate reductase-like domain-containing protein [Zychaea mexicana]|uniref:dihydrofolate reductase-like domain-containing protein n=1 Tax=Zychaea mexicana TaxID=64656 RepID=UPI0022FDC935|nr:dihydrofolate reductase-like domain-containing protein [Zychaea mexicana]KAI9488981.1 dihydrofolate reductase-like domain-containing protein [Zychaea mexicana]
MTNFALVVAATEELGIGLLSGLPWRIPRDMAFFKHVTTHVPEGLSAKKNAVIMGRVTWESIPPKFRPLSDRFNIIVSRNPSYDMQLTDAEDRSTVLVSNMEDAFVEAEKQSAGRVFVIGGAQIYKIAIKHAKCTHIVLTRVRSKVDCDTFFPEISDEEFRLATHEELEAYVDQPVPKGVQTHKDLQYEFTMYVRKKYM